MERSGTSAPIRTAAQHSGITQQTKSVRTEEPNPTPQGLSLAAFPLNAALLLQNRSFASWAAELTGLSPSRLRPGAKATFRESTLHRAKERADTLIRSLFFKAGGTHEAAERLLSEIPSTRANRPSPYGDLLYALIGPDRSCFAQSFALAERLDDLAHQLDRACAHHSLNAYKDALLTAEWLEADEWWRTSEVDGVSDQQQVRRAGTWDELSIASRPVFSNAVFAFLAALDCEFTTAALEPHANRPWFLDLVPTLGPNVELELSATSIALPKWDKFRLPPRRLLELSHALLHYKAHRRWPAKAAGRSELMGRTGYDDVVIGNLFDGTKFMTLKVYQEIWRQLAESFGPRSELPPLPTPLLIAAQVWTATCVRFDSRKRIQQIVLLDEQDYRKWWATFRRARAQPLPPGGPIDAPPWL